MRNVQDLIGSILQETRKRGASFTEVLCSTGAYSLKRVTDGEAYQPLAGEELTAAFSCIVDGKRLSAVCDFRGGVQREIDSLFAKAQFLPAEEGEPFAPAAAFPRVSLPREILYDPRTAAMDDQDLVEAILRVNAVVEGAGFIFDGVIGQGVHEITFVNSVGTFQRADYTNSHLSIFGFDPKDRSISAYRTVAGKALKGFPIETLAADVAKKLAIQRDYLIRHKGSRINPFGGRPGPQRFDVIMEPSCWTGLLAIFSGQADAWNGKAYHEGTSFFSGKIGTRVMGENITIWDDPLHASGIPRPFDSEGYPKQKLLLVDKGIARNVVYDGALAKKYRATSTGHALPAAVRSFGAMPEHLVVEGGHDTVEEMIRASKAPTLWITTLHYIRSTHNQEGRTTGTTLHGVFLVENGEIVGPTEHLRFDESVPEALSRVTHIAEALPSLSMETDETPFIVPAMRSEAFRFVSVADRSTR